ncbi:hypothetical protein RJT34_31799 [Clitoria ternatea]|uniref:Transmembrane protein n=1 Tax=Clitoria ternatea TaxID=43366 RepID=A0AAN9EUX3_CLITE
MNESDQSLQQTFFLIKKKAKKVTYKSLVLFQTFIPLPFLSLLLSFPSLGFSHSINNHPFLSLPPNPSRNRSHSSPNPTPIPPPTIPRVSNREPDFVFNFPRRFDPWWRLFGG